MPNAMHLRGKPKQPRTPYVPGGTDTQGFDCSGFVQWAYRNVGVTLPRTARAIRHGPPHQVRLHDGGRHRRLQPSPARLPYGHLSRRRLVHPQSRTRQSVSIAALSDPYFSSTFIGARRVQSKESDAEEAIKKLMALDSRKPTRTHKAALTSSQQSARHKKQTSAQLNTAHRPIPAAKRQPRPQNRNRAIQKAGQPLPLPPGKDDAFASDSQSRNENRTLEKEAPGKQAAQAPNTKRVPYPQRHPGFGTGQLKPHPPRRKEGTAQPATKPQTAAQNGQPVKPTSNTQNRPKQGGTARRREKAVRPRPRRKRPKRPQRPCKWHKRKPAQNSRASAKAPTNSAPVKARPHKRNLKKPHRNRPPKRPNRKRQIGVFPSRSGRPPLACPLKWPLFLPREFPFRKPSFRENKKAPRRQSGREPFWECPELLSFNGVHGADKGEGQRTWANTDLANMAVQDAAVPMVQQIAGVSMRKVSPPSGKIEIDLHGHGGGGQRDAARPLGHDRAVHMPAAQAHPRRMAQDIGKAAHILEVGSSIAPMPVTNGDGA